MAESPFLDTNKFNELADVESRCLLWLGERDYITTNMKTDVPPCTWTRIKPACPEATITSLR